MKPPRKPDPHFLKGSYLDWGFKRDVGGVDMGLSTTYNLIDADHLPAPEAAKMFNDHMDQEYGKKYETTKDGKIIVYHGTSKAGAEKLAKNGARAGLFGASAPDGDFSATHYGDHVVKMEVDPRDLLVIDDTGDVVLLSKNKAEHHGK